MRINDLIRNKKYIVIVKPRYKDEKTGNLLRGPSNFVEFVSGAFNVIDGMTFHIFVEYMFVIESSVQ